MAVVLPGSVRWSEGSGKESRSPSHCRGVWSESPHTPSSPGAADLKEIRLVIQSEKNQHTTTRQAWRDHAWRSPGLERSKPGGIRPGEVRPGRIRPGGVIPGGVRPV